MNTPPQGFSTNELGEIITIPEAARRAGWSRWRMRTHLVRLNEELGGLLLVDVSHGKERPRWTVSVAALKLVHPQWFQNPESLQQQLDELRDEHTETRLRVVRLEKRVVAVEARASIG